MKIELVSKMKECFMEFTSSKDKTVIKNIVAALIIKGSALIISFLSLPAFIKFFNNQELLGAWFTILSVLTWILSFDFGIGNGLRNKLVGALVRNNKEEATQYISAAYIIIGSIVLITSSIGVFGFQYVNWNAVFKISEVLVSASTMHIVVLTIFLTIMLQFFLRIVSFIVYALQKSAINNFLALITSASMLFFVLVFPPVDTETNIKLLSLAYFLCVNVPLFVATIVIFSTELKGCLPSLKLFNKSAVTSILSLGGIFFWNQILYMLITGTNSIFITNFIGPGCVVDYQIYYRLFSIAGMLFTLALTPMWSAITKAFEENDIRWITKYFKLANHLVLLIVVCEFIFVPFLQPVVDIWLGNNSVKVDYLNGFIFALFGSIFVYHNVLSTFACGIGKMRLQAIFYTVGILIKFLFIYYGTMLYNNWIVIVISDIVILAPYCLAQHIALEKQFFRIRQLENIRTVDA